jgi:colanic acid/amylovoran biosynthesis glycosyltransferase
MARRRTQPLDHLPAGSRAPIIEVGSATGRNSERDASPVRVGYLFRMYPRFSQTFIVSEILELERQGLNIRIASLRKPTEGRFHELVCRVHAEVDYLPETFSGHVGKTCGVHGALLRGSPRTYLAAAATALRRRGATLSDFRQAGHVLRWARKKRVDHLHVHFGTSEATVAWLANTLGDLPFSLALHAVDIFRDDVDRALLGQKINASCFTVVNSEFNRRYVVENFPGVDPDRLRLCYNGVDLERFKPTGRRRRKQTILTVGRLVEKKGFIHLVRAVGLLRDAGLSLKCKIVGDGPEKRRLRQEIDRLGLRSQVVLTRPLQHEQLGELMQRYSCFVLPCVRARDGNMDGIPNVLIEALAAGCPAISSDLSGVGELIEHGATGLLVPPGDEAALARSIRDILTSDGLASQLAVAGRRRVEERFAPQRNMRRLYDWLVTAAEQGRDGRLARAPDQTTLAVRPIPRQES